jgi:hypothetical protein
MKVGDLVELSASGYNTIYCQKARGKTGIIIEIRPKGMYPIEVFWFGTRRILHRRPNLKFVSKIQKTS